MGLARNAFSSFFLCKYYKFVSIKRYIFRGLYEVNSNNPKIANKLFAPGYGQNILNANKFHNFINYQSNNGEFIRIKFNNANEKKFNTDTVIVY